MGGDLGQFERSPGNRSNPSLLQEEKAAAIVEFAVALPLLVVLVVGIFDFGAAFNLKQELNNAMREGARFGASQPTNDLESATPPSVDAVRYLVDSYLQGSKINDCGLGAMTEPAASGTLTWVYNTTGTCSGQLSLTIVRGCTSAASCPNPGAPSIYLPTTHVQITYPYKWQFSNVLQLVAPGAKLGQVAIVTDAWAVNMD
jgi:TadE-like protein